MTYTDLKGEAAYRAALDMVDVDAFEDITLIFADRASEDIKIVDQPRGTQDTEEYAFGSMYHEDISENEGVICIPLPNNLFLQFTWRV
jgi:hypothetical protein